MRRGAAYAAVIVARRARHAPPSSGPAPRQARTERDRTLSRGAPRGVASCQDELRELTDTVHRDEVARTQQRLRIEQLQAKAVEELGIDPEVLMEEFGPHQLVPPVPGPDDDPDAHARAGAFVREVQEKRLRKAERALTALGRVNPLALEEFAALEERHKFLTEQLEDLKKSKRDLLDIVREVDERVERVFAEAFAGHGGAVRAASSAGCSPAARGG